MHAFIVNRFCFTRLDIMFYYVSLGYKKNIINYHKIIKSTSYSYARIFKTIEEENNMKKILIPIDGSEYSQRAILKGREMVKAFDSELILLNVVSPLIPNLTVEESVQFLETMKKQSQKILEEAKALFSEIDQTKIQLVSLEGDASASISNYVERENIDLVIMGSQGLNAGRIRGLFIGSVTRKVLYSIKTPILVIK